MRHRIAAYSIIVFLTCFSGCIVSLIPPERPLEERVVAGYGDKKVLLIDISGTISMEEEPQLGGFKREPSIVAKVKEILRLAQKDEDIKAIVLKINSPGGTVTASDIIHHEISALKRRTGVKVVACMMELGTSGAYYIATAADRIVSHPTTVTGSVGVIVLKLNMAELMQKVGVQEENIKSGDKKDILLPLRSMSPDERELIQQIVNELQQRFIQVIKDGRQGINPQQLEQIADGRILSSKDAKRLGLIDQIGYLNDAIESAKQLAGLPEARVIMYQSPYNRRANIYTQATAQVSQQNSVHAYLKDLLPSVNPYFMYMWLP